ncbi:nicotinate phosphoribosyltransferase [Thiohalomonas denitrificans]|uniref:Nicotinate phosphoribosyltransferase n=1 Tax=Thiohalomonas denitrificans TaxID=415747 RepID=A0A1G5PI53_9GAMM|nr:nicotinate phosphoribosyltransferase [Thiohalomonas denitrificans]SCZ49068.1 nicotinate phosphoribosyltransferase [Thiohalomonas denitrificans]
MDLRSSPLLTDLYQLTMLDGYFEAAMEETAVFEFFVRKLPDSRNFLMAAGLEQLIEFLENLQFTKEELQWLADSGRFRSDFVDYLAGLRFTGDVDAMLEGTLFFADEPILQVVAPLPQAQLIESRLINILHLQTMLVSKAARCMLAAPEGSLLVDFGMRRAHGADAALYAARASYLAGFAGTATVYAGPAFGIPLYGTMAHSFIQAHARETDAFETFARAQPDNVILLIDTYDTEAAAEKVVQLAPRLQADGIAIKGVRLDSGDLAEHARKVRKILDAGGLDQTVIFASGDIDEHKLADFENQSAPISGFGIGTRLDTSSDAPYLNCAYKLTEYAGQARRKRSEGKEMLPGRKQVFRHYDNGIMSSDTIAREGEEPGGEALLQPVMRGGKRVGRRPTLAESREHAARQLATLPAPLRGLGPASYPVHVSNALKELTEAVDRFVTDQARQ